ncbi:methyltransferase domain-containing protein [Aurantibacter crassamenti]|uniref:class I SAM-dependent methyltransferase n=1 Tax=Aurantibacter crassamenti TaxID=1837375 RepID=UPI00193A623D|nr:class I SAM-dependent methyltransferase [Aurantibacter crassamenti]MBM1106172.1 methyltransferase domain-containing protein [Aurantibacter crassamenti]
MTTDVFGKALLDYHSSNYPEDITTHSSLDEEDVIPLPYLFRDFKNMPKIEQLALENCRGKVLDIGCGSGSHSLYLQKNGISVTALDISEGAIEVSKARGVTNTILSNVMNYSSDKFDTLLLLMNGIGIVGELPKLDAFLNHARQLLTKDGYILLDSSDIIFMYETENGDYDISDVENYYGEVEFTMSYHGEKSKPFKWLYVDFDTLNASAERNGFHCELLFEGEHFDYLAKLYPTT